MTNCTTKLSETERLFFGKIKEPLALLSTPAYQNTLKLPPLEPHDSGCSIRSGTLLTGGGDQNPAGFVYNNAHHISYKAQNSPLSQLFNVNNNLTNIDKEYDFNKKK